MASRDFAIDQAAFNVAEILHWEGITLTRNNSWRLRRTLIQHGTSRAVVLAKQAAKGTKDFYSFCGRWEALLRDNHVKPDWEGGAAE